MTNKDFEILDGIIDNNKLYFITQSFGEYLDGTLRDSLNEFIHDYKVEEIDPNLDNDDWDNEEDIIYNIFWQLIPFLKKKYHDVFYDYYMGYHTQRENINESQDKRLFGELPNSVKRRMTERDFDILDDVIHNNKRYYVAQDFDRYLEGNLRDSLNEFIHDYKLEEINQDLDYDDLDDEENIKYKIFWQLIPFLEKKYHDLLYDYHMEYHGRSGNVNESSDNKRKHLYRRVGEIEDVLNEFEDLFTVTAKGLNKDGFIHATSMFIGDILAGRLEEKETDFDYVTFRNQIKRFVETHFYEELSDFYNKHKKQLTESQDERLFGELPNSLKRRLEPDDFEYFDRELTHYILYTPPVNKFDDFSSVVIGDLLHDFIMDKKVDEIETEEDPDYGVVYNEESRNKIMGMYWDLKPILIKKYKDRLYKAWERKKSISL